MRRALRLARRGEGYVEPNPMVGAVVVQGAKCIAQGYHRRFGHAHAEVEALRAAGPRARGATLYVTLEPCCHFGKTPPCTDAILRAGVRRVVVAMIDPFAKVHGRGVRLLRDAGVQVDIGLLEDEARRVNAPFLTRIRENRPFLIAKWAQSLDGGIATASGESRWISSQTSRDWVHRLRGSVDGILIGAGTALRDDPTLTARPRDGRVRRIATRIVLDSHCRLPLTSRLVSTLAEAPLLVVHVRTLSAAAERRRRGLMARGVMTLGCPADTDGRPRIAPLLAHLSSREYTRVLVEGGPQTLASFFRCGYIDEAHVFVAPIIIGGPGAPHAIGGPDLHALAAAQRLTLEGLRRSGPDAHLTLRRVDGPSAAAGVRRGR